MNRLSEAELRASLHREIPISPAITPRAAQRAFADALIWFLNGWTIEDLLTPMRSREVTASNRALAESANAFARGYLSLIRNGRDRRDEYEQMALKPSRYAEVRYSDWVSLYESLEENNLAPYSFEILGDLELGRQYTIRDVLASVLITELIGRDEIKTPYAGFLGALRIAQPYLMQKYDSIIQRSRRGSPYERQALFGDELAFFAELDFYNEPVPSIEREKRLTADMTIEEANSTIDAITMKKEEVQAAIAQHSADFKQRLWIDDENDTERSEQHFYDRTLTAYYTAVDRLLLFRSPEWKFYSKEYTSPATSTTTRKTRDVPFDRERYAAAASNGFIACHGQLVVFADCAIANSQFNEIAELFDAYISGVFIDGQVDSPRKRQMVAALETLQNNLTAHRQAADGIIAIRRYAHTVSLAPTGLLEVSTGDPHREVTLKEFINDIEIAKGLLHAADATAIGSLESDYKSGHSDQGRYDVLDIQNSDHIYVNPFYFGIVYALIRLPRAAHEQASMKIGRTIHLQCDACQEGQCLESALLYQDPKPTKEQLATLTVALEEVQPESADDILRTIFRNIGIPYMLVSNGSDFGWTIIDASQGYEDKQPWMVDVSRVAVIYLEGSAEEYVHAWRVTSTQGPKLPFLSIDWSMPAIPPEKHITVENITNEKTWTIVEDTTAQNNKRTTPIAPYQWHKGMPLFYRFGANVYRVRRVIDPAVDRGMSKATTFATEGFELYTPSYRGDRKLALLDDTFPDGTPIVAPSVIETLRTSYKGTRIGNLPELFADPETDGGEKAAAFRRAIRRTAAKGKKPGDRIPLPILPEIFLYRIEGSKRIQIYPPPNKTIVTLEDLANKPHALVFVSFQKKWFRAVDYHTTISVNDRRISYAAIGEFKVQRGETEEQTIQLGAESKEIAAESFEELEAANQEYAVIGRINENAMKSQRFTYERKTRGFRFDAEHSLVFIRFDHKLWQIYGTNPYKVNEYHEKEPLIIAMDFETGNRPCLINTQIDAKSNEVCPIIFDMYAIEDGKATEHRFEGPDCAKNGMEFVRQLCEANRGRRVIGLTFNGNSFDNFPILQAILGNPLWGFGAKKTKSEILRMGRKILTAGVSNFKLIDLYKFAAPSSLDTFAQQMGCTNTKSGWNHLESQKLFEKAGCNPTAFLELLKKTPAVNLIETRFQTPADKNRTAYDAYHDYCLTDCRATLESYMKLREAAQFADPSVDIIDTITVNQLGAKCFSNSIKRLYYKRKHYRTHARSGQLIVSETKHKLRFCKPVACDGRTAFEMYQAAKRCVVAGRSERHPFAPKGFVRMWLLYQDIVSLYPFIMQHCRFVIGDHCRWVDRYVDGKIGFYDCRIITPPIIPITPLKAQDTIPEGGTHPIISSHSWEFKGPFDTSLSSVMIKMIRYFGGEVEIKEGFICEEDTRGIMSDMVERFKQIKQEMDYYGARKEEQEHWKAAKDDRFDAKELAKWAKMTNKALRQFAKMILNALSGKVIEQPKSDKSKALRTNADKEKFITFLEEKSQKYSKLRLLPRDVDGFTELTDREPTPELFTWDIGLDQAVAKDKSIKSIMNGILIYDWSKFHMTMGLIANAYLAEASCATETDSHIFDRPKFEQHMAKIFTTPDGHPRNPYDMVAATKEEIQAGKAWVHDPRCRPEELLDRIFDMNQPIIYSEDKEWNQKPLREDRLGFYYCPAAAQAWAKANNVPWTPRKRTSMVHIDGQLVEREVATDFGDYTCESGIDANGDFYEQWACFLGKKNTYVEIDTDRRGKEKITFKGVGKKAVDATNYINYHMARVGTNQLGTVDATVRADPEYREVLATAMAQPGLLSEEKILHNGEMKTRGRVLFETLAAGYAVEALEMRFQGSLEFLADGCEPLRCSNPAKRLRPAFWHWLIIRSEEQTIWEKQCVQGEAHGNPPCIATVDGKQLSQDDMRALAERIAEALEADPNSRGETFDLNGYAVYVHQPTMRYVVKHLAYFTGAGLVNYYPYKDEPSCPVCSDS